MGRNKAKAGASNHGVTVVKDSDGTSSLTAIAVDSDSDTSSTVTLVDLFPGLAAIEIDDTGGDASAESTSATTGSAVSTSDESRELSPKRRRRERKMKDKAADTAGEATTSSAEASNAEAASSDASAGEVATTTSGETSSNDASTTEDAFSKSAQSLVQGKWTPSEDALIISMKEGGETWASIGNAINKGKNEVKKRWHVVKAHNANSAESAGDVQTGDERQDDGKKPEDKKVEDEAEPETRRTKADKKQKKKGKSVEKPAEITTSAKTKQKKNKVEKHVPKPPSPTSSSSSSSEEEEEEEEEEEDDDDDARSSYRERLNLLRDTSASDSASSATSGDEADSPGYYERELTRQERYIRRHVHPALYPPLAAALAPGEVDRQQRRDDAVLASIVSKREATKWLEMQANFCNVTGRMVPLHLIKARCEAEEDRGRAAGVRSWADSVVGGEDMLDPNVGGDDVPEDALIGDED
ncbi:hypothetical protein CCHL11_08230 [Colletotrichum chlorophyti]|uniref:Myb-like domain-containing protein n=1 Tax=Colletotrichum chlorophyti TaxID=708187 RepID=A0A1Q8RJF0_9PEZI|nr:hypothetical protein CCHL11_08230 [Colletotrichum chlorophyti]